MITRMNETAVKTLTETIAVEMHGKGYGMPSSHAQFVAYFSTFLILFMLFRHDPHNHPSASKTHVPIPMWQRILLSIAAVVCAGAVAQSRIYLKYHKPRQVYVGIAAGMLCAVAWFIVTGIARRNGVIDWLLDLPPARWARMRDLVIHEDLVDAGWERWEARRMKRSSAAKSNGGDWSKKKSR